MPYEVITIWTDARAIIERDRLITKYGLPDESIPPVLEPDPLVIIPEPEPEPEPVPPVQSSGPLYPIYFSSIWGVRLKTSKRSYRNRNIYNRNVAGTTIAIRLPMLDRNYRLRVTDIETTGTTKVRRYGVLSWNRNFDIPFLDDHIWGLGGNVSTIVGPEHSLMTLYFNHRIMPEDGAFAPWWSTLSIRFSAR